MQIRDIMRIAAFIPSYRSGLGAGLAVLFRDGSTGWVDVRLRSFIGRLASAFTVDVSESRRRFGPIVGQKNLVPLILAPLFLYVPIKTRIPLVSGDPAYGYYRLRSVLKLSPDPAPSTIHLEGGQEVTVQQSLRTVRSRLRMAHKLEAYLFEQFCLTVNDREHQTFYYSQMLPTGIASANDGVGSMEIGIRNLMEEWVFQQLDEVLLGAECPFCRCASCRLDAAILALNELPSRYVVMQHLRTDTYPKFPSCEDVQIAVTKALNEVRKYPRHEPNM